MAIEDRSANMYNTITQRLEVVTADRIKNKLLAGNNVKGYWGTAPTGKPHIGYLVPLVKVAEFVAEGIDFTILIADLYGFLVNYDVCLETVEYRTQYYTSLITAILKSLGVPTSKVRIVRESEYSMTQPFCKDSMRMCSVASLEDIKLVGLEVTKTPMMSPLLCPIHHALDEVYLGCDFQLGGLDQLGFFAFADRCLPRIGYEPVSHLAAAIIPGLTTEKMSSSAPAETKISFLDPKDIVDKKIAGAHIRQGDISANAIMAIFQHIIFPLRLLGIPTSTMIEVRLLNGSIKQYRSYELLELDFLKGVTDQASLRSIVAETINQILEPVREQYKADAEWRLVEKLAYAVC
ncbi:uncharacterized protein ATNIH1004_005347 [Aspergillus tanneri]|uniref:tyrosine--tRNA ligase n=1 Tax=Aspergillus tanneri TaxID=1220188 RepID=A0A5M9MI56_9EURO|nr:uncharacterized protein ATNIH1004_005347 [Aspergillus tanneri]KAA8646672.1 hypothetical protein ATNIH1004_005347 [Aspergillus tanneri]